MALKRYIGARYTPMFMGAWDKASEYAALSVVYTNEQSYVSRKTVPANTEITNTEFWIKSADWNAQVTQYNQNVEQYEKDVQSYAETVNDLVGKTVYTYNTKDDMAADKRVQLNDTLMTCGYAEVNDKKGSFYKVTEQTSAKAIALQNNLFALPFELTETADSDIATPQQFGAIGDGIADDTAAMQSALNTNKGVVVINSGTYNISHPLTLAKKVTVICSTDATIKATAPMEAMIKLTADSGYAEINWNSGNLDCNNNATDGIKADSYYHCDFNGLNISNFTTNGIYADTRTSGGAYLGARNCKIIGKNTAGSVGVNAPGSDEHWEGISVVNCDIGFYIGSNQIISNCTTWRDSDTRYNNSVGIMQSTGYASVYNFTCDTTKIFFLANTNDCTGCLISGLFFTNNENVVADPKNVSGVVMTNANSNYTASITNVHSNISNVDMLINPKNETNSVVGAHGVNSSYKYENPLFAYNGAPASNFDNCKTAILYLNQRGINATSVTLLCCDTAGGTAIVHWDGNSLSQTDIKSGIVTNQNGVISSTNLPVRSTVIGYK